MAGRVFTYSLLPSSLSSLLSLSYFVWDMLQVRRETVRVTVLVVSIVPG